MARGAEAIAFRKKVRRLRCENKSRRRKGWKGPKLLQGFKDLEKLEALKAAGTRAQEARKVGGCMVPGCERKHHAKGLCSKHYKQFRRVNGKGD